LKVATDPNEKELRKKS